MDSLPVEIVAEVTSFLRLPDQLSLCYTSGWYSTHLRRYARLRLPVAIARLRLYSFLRRCASAVRLRRLRGMVLTLHLRTGTSVCGKVIGANALHLFLTGCLSFGGLWPGQVDYLSTSSIRRDEVVDYTY